PPHTRGLPLEVHRALSAPLQKDPALRPECAASVVEKLRAAAESVDLQQWKTLEIPRRLHLSAGLALVIAVLGWLLPFPTIPPLERWFQDVLIRTAPGRPPSERLLLVLFSE